MDIDINFKTSNVSQQDQEKLRKELEQVHKIFPYDNHICCCVHEKGKKLEAIVRIFCHSDQFGVYAMAKDSSQLLQRLRESIMKERSTWTTHRFEHDKEKGNYQKNWLSDKNRDKAKKICTKESCPKEKCGGIWPEI